MHEDIVSAIRDRTMILFVGAGATATLGVPSWRGLIDHMAIELGQDPERFAASANSFMSLAEYHRICHGEVGPLRSWMDTNWRATDEELRQSRVHRLIADLDVPLIYTTNYDRFLERSLLLAGRNVIKIVNVRDIGRARPDQVQVVKLHGDFDSDESIVLTESDFFSRLSLEAPIDVKLRADMLGRSVLFIGYSLTDINIRLLLFKLTQAWEASGHGHLRPRSYIFSTKADPIQEAVLGRWGVQLISEDSGEPSDTLCTFLERLVTARQTTR